MAKLYPPYIEGTLPAFISNGGTLNIRVPFEYNRGVNPADVENIAIKIKTVQNDVLLEEKGTLGNKEDIVSSKIAIFNISNEKFKLGQYYKIQIAFVDKSKEIGFYSTVGVAKYVTKPILSIKNNNKENLKEGEINSVSFYKFLGIYEQKGDITEKLYSSYFEIFDDNLNLIFKSEPIAHSIENDSNSYTATEEFLINKGLESDSVYKIRFNVITTNGYEASSSLYSIQQQKGFILTLNADLVCQLDKDQACVTVSLKEYLNEKKIAKGTFILTREESTNPGVWEEMTKFVLVNEHPDKLIYTDFVVDQGKTYRYAIQQHNQYNIFTERRTSNSVYVDYEDIFLFDGERQLKIMFNPQINNFKTQLAETRTETIGNKYPFFFRNARIEYKTFPISGLISMLSDENDYFITDKEIKKENFDGHRYITNQGVIGSKVYKHTDLLSKNIISERIFKLEVLDWFNNGKVKLFKSPVEGSYLVRLMDTSMAPNVTLGRMLHTINTTAYECADLNYSNLVKYGIIKEINQQSLEIYDYEKVWRTYTFTDHSYLDKLKTETEEGVSTVKLDLLDSNMLWLADKKRETGIDYLELIDFPPGTLFEIGGKMIRIGATGTYKVSNVDITSLYWIKESDENDSYNLNSLEGGIIKYSYLARTNQSKFEAISKMAEGVNRVRQFVGANEDLMAECDYTTRAVTNIFRVDFHKRPIEYIYYTLDDGQNLVEEKTTKIQEVIEENENEVQTVEIEQISRILNPKSNIALYWDYFGYEPIDINDLSVLFYHSPFSLYLFKEKPNKPWETGENLTSDFSEKMSYNYHQNRINLKISAESEVENGSYLFDPYLYDIDKNNYIIHVGQDFPLEKMYTVKYGTEENSDWDIDLKEINDYSITSDIEIRNNKAWTTSIGTYGELYYNTFDVEYKFLEKSEPGSTYQIYENCLKEAKNNPTWENIKEMDDAFRDFDNQATLQLAKWSQGESQENNPPTEEPEGENDE